jgi:hypothetical protein
MNQQINILLLTILAILGVLFVVLSINFYFLFDRIKKSQSEFLQKHIDKFSRVSISTQFAWIIISGKYKEIADTKTKKQCAVMRFFYFVYFFCFVIGVVAIFL